MAKSIEANFKNPGVVQMQRINSRTIRKTKRRLLCLS